MGGTIHEYSWGRGLVTIESLVEGISCLCRLLLPSESCEDEKNTVHGITWERVLVYFICKSQFLTIAFHGAS